MPISEKSVSEDLIAAGGAAEARWRQVQFSQSLLVCMGLLVVAHICTQAFSLATGHDVVMGLIPLFNFNAEANIPSFFSTLLLSAASGLLFVNAAIYRQHNKWFVKFWFFLALIFAFLAVDELSSLHERLTVPVRDSLGAEGVFYFAWVIPYAVLVLGVGLVMLRFMFRLDRSIAIGFAVAGTIFIMGAVGMEMLGGEAAAESGERSFKFVAFATVEEILEMSGVIIFIHFILKDIFARVTSLTLRLSPD